MMISDTNFLSMPPIISGNGYRSSCPPAEPYPVADATIINNFIIGDTYRLH